MKCLFWNLKGLGNVHMQRVLKTFCFQHKLAFLCLAQLLVAWDLVSSFFSNLGFSLVAATNPVGTLPTLVLSSSFMFSVSVCIVEVQHITIKFHYA